MIVRVLVAWVVVFLLGCSDPFCRKNTVSSTKAPIWRNSLSQFSKGASAKCPVVRYFQYVKLLSPCSTASATAVRQPVRLWASRNTATMAKQAPASALRWKKAPRDWPFGAVMVSFSADHFWSGDRAVQPEALPRAVDAE
jgi:hypothetical protein